MEAGTKAAQAPLAAVGGDALAFLANSSLSLSTTDVGRALGLGSARRLNPLLVEWGLLRARIDGYDGVDPSHGAVEGWTYPKWRWHFAGVVAIWAAAADAGLVPPGADEMIRRVQANTGWLPVDPSASG